MRIAKVQTNLRNFFHHWVNFTAPFHNLGKTERKVLGEFLYYRYLLSQEVNSEELLSKLLFDPDTKDKIAKRLSIPMYRINMIMTKLRGEGVMTGREISSKFIPDLKIKDKEYILAFKFNITGNEEGVYSKKSRKKTP